MRELEVKLFFGDEMNAHEMIERFRTNGYDVAASESQVDHVYLPPGTHLLDLQPGSVVARVRESDRHGSSLTVKIRRGADLDRDEIEFDVSDAQAAQQALEALGLHESVTVRKHRHKFRLDPVTTVQVDEVDVLGVFVEVEVLSEDDERSPDGALQAAVGAVRAMLQIEGLLVEKGYDRLLVEQGPRRGLI